MIERLLETVCQILRVILTVLVGALIIPVAMQVLARYTGIIPVYLWTEELATYLFIWIVMLGSIIAVWEGTHFDVRIMHDARTRLGKLLQQGFVLLMMSVFSILFFYYGIAYAKFGSIQQSVMMQVNLIVTYITIPIAGCLWSVFLFYRLWELYRDYRQTGESAS